MIGDIHRAIAEALLNGKDITNIPREQPPTLEPPVVYEGEPIREDKRNKHPDVTGFYQRRKRKRYV